ARRAGRPLLRRHEQRPRRDARLRLADRRSRPLGDRRLRQGPAAVAARARRRRSGGQEGLARPAARSAGGAGTGARDGTGKPQQAGGQMNAGASPAITASIDRVRRPALIAGVLALAACAAGAFLAPPAFFRAYLFAYVFFTGLSLGCLAVVMLHHLTGGAWGIPIRRMLESGTRTLPLITVLFIPVALGMKHLYSWARPEEVAQDAVLQAKEAYLNVPFFLARTVFYFAVWLVVAYFLNRWSLHQDRAGSPALTRKLQLLSAGGLVAYGLTMTFASIDWVMSLEPRWFSTMYGVLYIAGQALNALAFVTALLVLLSRQAPFAGYVGSRHFHDLGKLLLAFVMFWSYVA